MDVLKDENWNKKTEDVLGMSEAVRPPDVGRYMYCSRDV